MDELGITNTQIARPNCMIAGGKISAIDQLFIVAFMCATALFLRNSSPNMTAIIHRVGISELFFNHRIRIRSRGCQIAIKGSA
jgi:hypothetical protein